MGGRKVFPPEVSGSGLICCWSAGEGSAGWELPVEGGMEGYVREREVVIVRAKEEMGEGGAMI